MPGILSLLPGDPATIAAIEPHIMAAGAPLPDQILPPAGFVPLLVKNDLWPTCTVAGLINCARIWTLTKYGYDPVVDEELLIDFFCAVTNCTRETIAACPGARMLDILQAAQREGFRINSQDVLVPLFRRIEIVDTDAMHHAIATCGSVYSGWSLYQADLSLDGTWAGAPSGSPEGGHCAPEIGYQPGGFIDASWGEQKAANDEWALSHGLEAYSVQWTMRAA